MQVRHSSALATHWRADVLRTNLWLVPGIEVLGALALFLITLALDRAAYRGAFGLPSWVISGTADAARQILTAIAAAVITVVGVVFSIILVTLTLASTQFGPRMLRNFIRDRGTQLTLGTFVATFVYAVLVLVSIGPGPHGAFVPHIGVTVTLGLMVADMGVLIYFIHHTATSIQLPQVIASIAGDLTEAIRVQGGPDAVSGAAPGREPPEERGPGAAELMAQMAAAGGVVRAPESGYLQVIRHEILVTFATEANAVIALDYRPGHFLVQGHPFAVVWPPEAAPQVNDALGRAHVTGPYRTLTQDISFGIDQLVEIAIRALSAAVNDTFTALTCIDWLGDSLCKITARWHPERVQRDSDGFIRVITAEPSHERLVQRAFEKIRQASVGMPAVMIRQLDTLTKIMAETSGPAQRRVLLEQADMIQRASERSVPEAADRADVRRRYEEVQAAADRAVARPASAAPAPG
ncbi:MAG TPA: DUF2254 domain-containing protein [Streptosporangiaceae bacterium]|jgi:uncharacterized membrane protein